MGDWGWCATLSAGSERERRKKIAGEKYEHEGLDDALAFMSSPYITPSRDLVRDDAVVCCVQCCAGVAVHPGPLGTSSACPLMAWVWCLQALKSAHAAVFGGGLVSVLAPLRRLDAMGVSVGLYVCIPTQAGRCCGCWCPL